MMRKIVLILSFVTSAISMAQITTVVNGVNQPSRILVDGNYLYIVESGAGIISRIDYTISSPVVEDVVTGLSNPSGIAFSGTELFVCQSSEMFSEGWISKIDLGSSTSVLTDVITGLNSPADIVIKGNELFLSDPNSNTVSKMNIASSAPVFTVLASGLSTPFGLAIRGNYLYIAETSVSLIIGKISKINLSQSNPTVVEVISGPFNPFGLTFNGGDLYFSDSNEDRVLKTHVHVFPASAQEVVTNVNTPLGIAFINETDLYMAQYDNYRISKAILGYLSVEKDLDQKSIQVYPNPASSFIQISGLIEEEKYTIFDIYGAKVKAGKVSNNEKINIQNLENGLYLLKFKNGSPLKFVKE